MIASTKDSSKHWLISFITNNSVCSDKISPLKSNWHKLIENKINKYLCSKSLFISNFVGSGCDADKTPWLGRRHTLGHRGTIIIVFTWMSISSKVLRSSCVNASSVSLFSLFTLACYSIFNVLSLSLSLSPSLMPAHSQHIVHLIRIILLATHPSTSLHHHHHQSISLSPPPPLMPSAQQILLITFTNMFDTV